jgi:hypothetical protein
MLMLRSFIGYHGTSSACKEKICKYGFNIKKYTFNKASLEQVPGDLGAGAYFYLDSIENARKFAEKQIKEEDIAILKCEIVVAEENILDMDEEGNAEIFNELRNNDKELKALARRYKSNIGGKGRHNLDGVILESLIHKYNLDVHLVKKKTYTPFKGLPRNSNYFNGTELCVKKKDIIKTMVSVDYKKEV